MEKHIMRRDVAVFETVQWLDNHHYASDIRHTLRGPVLVFRAIGGEDTGLATVGDTLVWNGRTMEVVRK